MLRTVKSDLRIVEWGLLHLRQLAHAWSAQRTHKPSVPCLTHGRPTLEIKGLQY